jgi:site-specific recombinase XerD
MAFREINDLYQAAGLRVPSAPWHCLRHSFASHFLMKGGSLVALSRLLGHADVKTTQIYAHLAPDYLAEQVDKLKF